MNRMKYGEIKRKKHATKLELKTVLLNEINLK